MDNVSTFLWWWPCTEQPLQESMITHFTDECIPGLIELINPSQEEGGDNQYYIKKMLL